MPVATTAAVARATSVPMLLPPTPAPAALVPATWPAAAHAVAASFPLPLPLLHGATPASAHAAAAMLRRAPARRVTRASLLGSPSTAAAAAPLAARPAGRHRSGRRAVDTRDVDDDDDAIAGNLVLWFLL